jgi:hypothetical protein
MMKQMRPAAAKAPSVFKYEVNSDRACACASDGAGSNLKSRNSGATNEQADG